MFSHSEDRLPVITDQVLESCSYTNGENLTHCEIRSFNGISQRQQVNAAVTSFVLDGKH